MNCRELFWKCIFKAAVSLDPAKVDCMPDLLFLVWVFSWKSVFCSFGKDEVTSSNLVSSSSETRCLARDSGFSLLFDGRGCPVENPYRNPYRQNFKDQIALRLIGFLQGIPENLACPTHTFLVGVRIHPECHGLIAMTQHLRYAGYISAIRDGDTCEGMPLWHNKDKSENPCGATGWLVCPYSFSTKKGLETGLREGVITRGYT